MEYTTVKSFSSFLSFFKGKPKLTPKEIIGKTALGTTIRLRFKDPRKLGVRDPSGRLSKRFDPEDLKDFTLVGTLTNIFTDCGISFLELSSTKISPETGGRRERLYVLMFDELEEVTIL